MTKATTRNKFVRVCVEVDLTKPSKVGYEMRGREWRLQYEGLHELCFVYGHYSHRVINCQSKLNAKTTSGASTEADA